MREAAKGGHTPEAEDARDPAAPEIVWEGSVCGRRRALSTATKRHISATKRLAGGAKTRREPRFLVRDAGEGPNVVPYAGPRAPPLHSRGVARGFWEAIGAAGGFWRGIPQAFSPLVRMAFALVISRATGAKPRAGQGVGQ